MNESVSISGYSLGKQTRTYLAFGNLDNYYVIDARLKQTCFIFFLALYYLHSY